MPAGIINDIANIFSKEAASKPYYTLFLIVIIIFITIYSQRILNIKSNYYSLFSTIIILSVISLIIASTFLHMLNIKLKHEKYNSYVENFNHIFNSAGSRNFLLIFSFLLFVMFVYESPEFDNENPHFMTDKFMFGYNGILSNRTYGLLLLIFFGLATAYTVYVTTNENNR